MEIIGNLIWISILMMIFLGFPGGLTWLAARRTTSDAKVIGVFSSVLLILYGSFLGYLVCKVTWNGMTLFNDSVPRFGPWRPGPYFTDYLTTGWPGWVWLLTAIVLFVRQIIFVVRKNAKSSS